MTDTWVCTIKVNYFVCSKCSLKILKNIQHFQNLLTIGYFFNWSIPWTCSSLTYTYRKVRITSTRSPNPVTKWGAVTGLLTLHSELFKHMILPITAEHLSLKVLLQPETELVHHSFPIYHQYHIAIRFCGSHLYFALWVAISPIIYFYVNVSQLESLPRIFSGFRLLSSPAL